MARKLFGVDFWNFDSFVENVQKGDLVIGMANGYQDYGVFITIGGSLRGLVPIRYVSKNPLADPKQVFPLNKNTEFLVQSVDKEKQRITLSSTEFVVGESRARRNPIDIDYNEPIDNSKVDVPLGDKEICFLIPNANDEKAEKSFRVLTTSIKMLGNDAPYIAEYFSEMPNLSERAEFIIEQSFVSSMPTQTFLRNLSYDGKGGNDVTRIGFRLARQEGDAWDTNLRLPMNRTFLFEGRILDKGKSFCVDKILLVANSDSALSYEVPLEIINLDSPAKVRRTFIYDLVNKMVSFTKYTSKKLSLWTEYLDWSQKVAELQIKGVKYVDVALDQARKQLVFCLMFKNENEFKQMQRILRRQEIMVFNNRVSTDRYEFKYDNGENGHSKPRVTGIDLGNSMGIVGKPFDLAVAEKTLSIPSLR
ncbi:MAG: S1 RNA-binding domain-containing protein, partial [Candidatus Saccharibacteria bacterium]|nr:S1 RNA-binding domain-containing protein [Candidatus Saccharibacteria bacterium]